MSKIILLMVLSLSFVFSSCKSSVKKNIDKDTKKKLEKKTKKKDDCKCSYDTYYGSIKIVRLQNKSGKYNISFKFISESEVKNEEHRKSLLNTFLFKLANGEAPPLEFLSKYQITTGSSYKKARFGFLNNNAEKCDKFTYEVAGIDRTEDVYSADFNSSPIDLENREEVKSIRIRPEERPLKKPILYLYPLKDTKITVKLGKSKDIAHSYPKYPKNGWSVDVKTDGTIKYKNREYYSLYWEMNNFDKYKFDEGFLVSKKEVIPFLEKSLKTLGFKDKEAQEFIIYWLPKLESNDLNLIKFETLEYNKNQAIEITPKPDTLIRVMMIFKKVSNKNIKIKKQILKNTKRKGFVALEWGGIEL